jgi:hypothetical protein
VIPGLPSDPIWTENAVNAVVLRRGTARRGMTALELLLRVFFPERGVDFFLLDAGRRITRLIQILFFGAVAHHAGMGHFRWLLGIVGFIGHFRYSAREYAPP